MGVLTIGQRLALAALGEERAYDLEAAGDRALLRDDQQVVEEEEVALLGTAARDFLERPFQEELGAVDGKRRALPAVKLLEQQPNFLAGSFVLVDDDGNVL